MKNTKQAAPSIQIKTWRIFQNLASVKITLVCFGLGMVLVFWGTIAQVQLGTFRAQQVFFNSFFVFKEMGSIQVPVFPGGLLLGFAWLVNLVSAFIVRFRINKKKIGLFISHSGLILLLGGQCFTQLVARESQMPIEIGESRNYSESIREFELVFIDKSHPDIDEVTSIPDSLLRKNKKILHHGLFFDVDVIWFFPNSRLSMGQEGNASGATRGIGTRIHADEIPLVSSDEELNTPSVLIEIKEGKQSHGVWLVSSGLGAPQFFNIQGKDIEVAMRQRRHYFPFTLTLKEFHHDIYPGTDIPKNFSSLVRLVNPDKNEQRETLIYMNNPLRYDGKTFYQASFGKNDTLSVFQVVENPFYPSPYLGCALVILGLATHFLSHLFRFVRKTP